MTFGKYHKQLKANGHKFYAVPKPYRETQEQREWKEKEKLRRKYERVVKHVPMNPHNLTPEKREQQEKEWKERMSKLEEDNKKFLA